jgi:hypothetical protein
MIDKDYLLENITEENILNILADFNITPYSNKTKDNEIWFKTVCHGGDSHKLCYFRDSKTFYCYTNCGFMNIFSFLMKIINGDFSDALKLVAKELGINNRRGFTTQDYNRDIRKKFSTISKYLSIRRKKHKELIHLPKINNLNMLNYFENNVFYQGWIDEGISIPTMQKFDILWYESEKSIIIPHKNINGEIVGIRRRSLQEKDKDNKYMPLILEGEVYSHSLNMNFYGLWEHLNAIQRIKKAVIVESEKSVMLAQEYYGDNAFVIATCGFNISNWHRSILLKLGVNEVILGFDKDINVLNFEDYDENDPEYLKFQRYVNRVLSLAHKFTPFFTTYVLWDIYGKLDVKDSPFDKGKETLEFLMRNKEEITTNQ